MLKLKVVNFNPFDKLRVSFPERVPMLSPSLAQLAEQLPFKEKVPSSILGGRTQHRGSSIL